MVTISRSYGPPHGGTAPKVYVILLNWQGWALTLECLESLLRQDYPSFQVIVCDNGSQDDSVERLRAWAAGHQEAPVSGEGFLRDLVSPPVSKPLTMVEYDRAAAEAGGGSDDADAQVILLHTGGNVGFAAGNNVGLRYLLARGDGEYAWILNNDTVVGPDTLGRMVEAAAGDPALGIVGAKLLYFDAPDVIQAAAGGGLVRWKGMTGLAGQGEHDRGQCDGPVDLDYVHGASMLVRTRLCREVGLFDEAYFIYSEEVDWCIRAREAGWKLGYAPAARVWHKENRTIGLKSPRQDYHSLRSSLILARKFYPRLVPLVFAYSVYQYLLPKVVRRQRERVHAVLRAYRDFLRESR